MLTVTDLGQSFGGADIFSGISFTIQDDARIGLVGPNGIGKTSLLQILVGLATPTRGSVQIARGRTLGYLRQEAVEAFAARDYTVYAEMLTVFTGLLEHAAALRAMEAQMADGDHSPELLARYSAAQESFEREGGYDYEVRIAQVLEGLGFPRPQWDMPLQHLSGGQKTRALLARLLLEAPDLLILDEPTNHLDVEAVEWLERTLRTWKGALLVVSHDRYFLDTVADRIWEMSRQGMEQYRGNYTAYVRQRQERWERREQVYEAEKERLEKEIDYIRRNIAGQNTSIARGKLKRLSRELEAIATLGLEGTMGKSWSETGVGGVSVMGVEEAASRIRAIPRPEGRPPQLTVHLRADRRSGNTVLRATNVTVGYAGKPLFTCQNIELFREDCAALIGPNGAGKTTFLRTVLGEIPPVKGEVKLGASLHPGYFAQAHDSLNPERQVIEELLAHTTMSEGEARNYLAQYLFRADDVYKLVRSLSGGERGRLALAILALSGANFLLLDEPTNHLDIPAQEVLQEGLERFQGTLLLVSHDRYLIDRLATQIWEVREGTLRVFKGTYQEYLAAREREEQQAKEAAKAAAVTPVRQNTAAGSVPVTGKEAKKRAQAISAIEAQIAETEAKLAEWTRQLQEESEAQRYEEVQRLGEAYTATQAQLEALMADWMALAADEVR
jgi:ATP-binding cassette subfamily F protein 3